MNNPSSDETPPDPEQTIFEKAGEDSSIQRSDTPTEILTESSNSTSASNGLLGSMLGEFRILKKLGQGGMAEVYLAEQTSLRRQVAIKVMREDRIDQNDDHQVKRFQREATSAAGLTHPNIVQVYTFGFDQGVHYIAQEYVDGITLKEYLRKQQRVSTTVALKFLRQIAQALEAAHELGIIHRDIKPENILLNKKMKVKVADFGLAHLANPPEDVQLTQAGIAMGTPLYMSPEQVNGTGIDHRSDIYSLGVTIYHLLAGTPPFQGESALGIAMKHVHDEAVPLKDLQCGIPNAVSDMIQNMMAKDPSHRYQNCTELLSTLKTIIHGLQHGTDVVVHSTNDEQETLEATISISSPEMPAISKQESWFAGNKKSVLLFTGLGLALLAGLVFLFPSEDPTTENSSGNSDSHQVSGSGNNEKNNRNVTPQQSAEAQYLLASNIAATEKDPQKVIEAWELVIQKFPNDDQYRPKAEARLALWKLQNHREGKVVDVHKFHAILDPEMIYSSSVRELVFVKQSEHFKYGSVVYRASASNIPGTSLLKRYRNVKTGRHLFTFGTATGDWILEEEEHNVYVWKEELPGLIPIYVSSQADGTGWAMWSSEEEMLEQVRQFESGGNPPRRVIGVMFYALKPIENEEEK